MPEKYNSGLNTETYPVDINIFIKKTDFVMYSNQWLFTYSIVQCSRPFLEVQWANKL